jgi:dTDP-4-amino-4,6-dideoxy-D-galactose acyltransferase
MVEALTWDSQFFGRRIGVLAGGLTSIASVSADLAAAAAAGFVYVICRPPVEDAAAVQTLERAGFYLTDVGVTWSSEVGRYLRRAEPVAPGRVRLAVASDVPRLSSEATTLFRRSRFYHDPFFSTDDADRLHAAWLANSVSGQAADAVLIIPDAGFVTCKLTRDGSGEVALIGVWEECRGRGEGRTLMTAAVTWFAGRGVTTVRVKTQVKNLRAMNFYHRLEFDLYATDMTMGCILDRRPAPNGSAS